MFKYDVLLNVPIENIGRGIGQFKKENKIEFKGAPKTGDYYRLIDQLFTNNQLND